jgi:quercetin dioxygenase-like cupin family protein
LHDGIDRYLGIALGIGLSLQIDTMVQLRWLRPGWSDRSYSALVYSAGKGTQMRVTRIVATGILIVGSGLALVVMSATQPSGIRRADVLRQDLALAGREVIQVRVDFAPGAAFERHSHPGTEIAYVLEGTLEYQLDGESPVTLGAGEALFIPEGAIHAARNVGPGGGAELATYIVEKGKLLVVLAE